MTQYYITELQTYADGSFGDIKHVAWDEDPTKARLKAESKFHEVLAAAAVTSKDFTQVALTLQDADGNIIENKKIDTLYGEE